MAHHDGMGQDFSHVVSDMETICLTLENIIKSSFGPSSQYTLLSSSTGHVTLSSDGLTILTSLHLSHPIARVVVKSLESSMSIYGDGCKTMIIYLSSLIRAMSRPTDICKYRSTLSATNSETFFRCFLSRSLYSFVSLDLPKVIDEMTKSLTMDAREDLNSYVLDDVLFHIVKPIIGGSLSSEACLTHVAKVLIAYLLDNCATVDDVVNRCDWFNNSVYLIPNRQFESSCVMTGILLMSRISTLTSLPLRDFRFLCLLCPIEGIGDSGDTSIVQMSSSEIFLTHRHSVLARFVFQLQKAGISLIISISKIPDFCLQHFFGAQITVIDCVDETDLQWMCRMCGKSPVSSMRDKIDATSIMKASICEKVTFGQKSFAKIVLAQGEGCCPPKSVFLCAPSEGISQQLKIKAKRCMTVICHLLNSAVLKQDKSLSSTFFLQRLKSNIISGQGYFEMLLCDHLHIYSTKACNSDTQMCCKLVRKMLLEVPKVLCQKQGNLCLSKNSSHRNLLSKINLLDSSGLLDHSGPCRYPVNHGILEVLSIKIALVFVTVNLAVKLLRMDKIIAVRGRVCDESESQDPEYEDNIT